MQELGGCEAVEGGEDAVVVHDVQLLGGVQDRQEVVEVFFTCYFA